MSAVHHGKVPILSRRSAGGTHGTADLNVATQHETAREPTVHNEQQPWLPDGSTDIRALLYVPGNLPVQSNIPD